MSLNKGKAKAKPAMKAGGKPAVMNRRKYNEAISGDTMSNYAMYKKGGKVKKYQSGGGKESYADKIVNRIAKDDSVVGKRIIKPAAKAFLSGVEKTGQAVKKYGPKLMEAGSKMERGPKFKKGGSTFPDLTGDGKVTRADILKGRGVIKKGGTIKKKK